MLVHNGNIDDARHKYGVFNEEVLHGLDLVDLWIGQLMQALEDSGHLHDTDVIIVSDHGQMDLSRVIKPNVFLADAGLIQVDENGNLRDWTAFCCSNAMSAMVYLKDPQMRRTMLRPMRCCKDGRGRHLRLYDRLHKGRNKGHGAGW